MGDIANREHIKVMPLNGFTEDEKEIFENINNKDDFISVLLAVSYIDSRMEDLLRAYLIEDKDIDKIFNPSGNGPLNTYTNRVKMCYYLGLITKTRYEDLKIVHNIRNIFAHNCRHINFEQPQITKLCDKIKYSTNLNKATSISFKSSKSKFIIFVVTAIIQLKQKIKIVPHREKLDRVK